ncbi:NAD-dependent epimerase/dehydratase family protein [Kineococcus siccus]|uniref:NAD-dependent epimerase/dehydratase family protein n=1 Tax=Kineococcus siccus TaxID=2696567 RepID=UPI00196B5AC2|nr:NAD-dependent epimerase/dehydratase family protein [Kineococcus siccus]
MNATGGRTVLLTGAGGMLGRAVQRRWPVLSAPGDRLVPVGRKDADLADQLRTRELLREVAPTTVVHCAARVGGIAANAADRAGFLMDNLRVDTNLLSAAYEQGVREVLYIGSSCMYPKDHRQPLVETDVLAGPLEPTNDGYALAKIAGASFCQLVSAERGVDYRVLVPSNLYGPGDDFQPGRAHLVAAALAKAHTAVTSGATSLGVWGDGSARREFTYVDDLADFLIRVLDRLADLPPLLNVGAGVDHSVADYHRYAAEVTGFTGYLEFDVTKPVGMHQKLMSSALAEPFGWAPATPIREGMALAYADYLERHP